MDAPICCDYEVQDFNHVVEEAVLSSPFQSIHDSRVPIARKRDIKDLALGVWWLYVLPPSDDAQHRRLR